MNKKHDYAALLKYMRMLEEGYSFIHISDKYGISEKRLKYLWALYQEQGASVLHRKKRTMVDGYLRKEIVLDFEKNDLTLVQGALRYGVSVDCLGDWVRTARREGIDALLISKKGKSMGRPRKKKPEEMTELERLRRENHLLKLELEIRKKAQALVEERKAYEAKCAKYGKVYVDAANEGILKVGMHFDLVKEMFSHENTLGLQWLERWYEHSDGTAAYHVIATFGGVKATIYIKNKKITDFTFH